MNGLAVFKYLFIIFFAFGFGFLEGQTTSYNTYLKKISQLQIEIQNKTKQAETNLLNKDFEILLNLNEKQNSTLNRYAIASNPDWMHSTVAGGKSEHGKTASTPSEHEGNRAYRDIRNSEEFQKLYRKQLDISLRCDKITNERNYLLKLYQEASNGH